MASANKDLNMIVLVCIVLLCIVMTTTRGDTGTATSSTIPTPAQFCKINADLSSSEGGLIATVSAPKYTTDMCGASYVIECDSDAEKDPSYVDPCNPDNNKVTVTIVGQCDDNVEDCSSFLQLSEDAYNTIADPDLSQLLRINYGPA